MFLQENRRRQNKDRSFVQTTEVNFDQGVMVIEKNRILQNFNKNPFLKLI